MRKTKSVLVKIEWEQKNRTRNEIIANVNKVGFTVTMTTRRAAAPLVILIFQAAAKRVKSHWKLHTALGEQQQQHQQRKKAITSVYSLCFGHAPVRTLKN